MDTPKARNLSGKIAVVTAAGQGIGRAIAQRLRNDGATVFASDLKADLLTDLSGAEVAALDATNPEAVQRYFSSFERIDILVHCVGYVHQGTIEECSLEDWHRSSSITLDSAFHVLKAGIPHMKAQGGSLITIASVASSLKGFPRRAAYGAAKGGVIGLTKAMAADYLPFNVRCNAICPGTVESPSLRQRVEELAKSLGSMDAAWKFFLDRQPSGRLGTPEEIAGVCSFLASDDAGFITGQTLQIDGGITI